MPSAIPFNKQNPLSPESWNPKMCGTGADWSGYGCVLGNNSLSLARALALSRARALSLSRARARALPLCIVRAHTHTRTHTHTYTLAGQDVYSSRLHCTCLPMDVVKSMCLNVCVGGEHAPGLGLRYCGHGRQRVRRCSDKCVGEYGHPIPKRALWRLVAPGQHAIKALAQE